MLLLWCCTKHHRNMLSTKNPFKVSAPSSGRDGLHACKVGARYVDTKKRKSRCTGVSLFIIGTKILQRYYQTKQSNFMENSMAPTEPKDGENTTVIDTGATNDIKPAGWQPEALPAPAAGGTTLGELQKLTPRQAELSGAVTTPSKLGTLVQDTPPSTTSSDSKLAPTDGPLEGNCSNIELLHSGSKWFWRPNIHLDIEIYALSTPVACYAARVNYRDTSTELPYLFFDKEKVDAEIDQEAVIKGPPLAPHEALKRARTGPRRTIDVASLSEEERAEKVEEESKVRQKRANEQASTICLNKIELVKNKETVEVKVFIKGSTMTGHTIELSTTDGNKETVESIRLPRTPFVKPENASVAEFRRINKLFEKHMDKAKEARASAEDIHQAQADVVEMLKTNIRHTIPNARKNATKFGKKVFSGLNKLKLIETRELLAAKGIK